MTLKSVATYLLEKFLENKLSAALLGAVSCLITFSFWFRESVEAFVSKVFPTPDISLVTILLEFNLLLILVIVLAYLWFRRKFVHPKPNLSKKSELQNQILNELKKEPMSCWIAKNLNEEESRIIKNLYLLQDDLLVSKSGNASSWYLTKHAYTYFHPTP